jgi:hypothetical protein
MLKFRVKTESGAAKVTGVVYQDKKEIWLYSKPVSVIADNRISSFRWKPLPGSGMGQHLSSVLPRATLE